MVVWSKTEEMCDRFIKNVVLNRMLFDQNFIHESCFFEQTLAFMCGGFFWSMLCMYEERFIFDQTLALMNRCVFIPFFIYEEFFIKRCIYETTLLVFDETLHLWRDARWFDPRLHLWIKLWFDEQLRSWTTDVCSWWTHAFRIRCFTYE